ncbi:MAG TPA: 5-formyltetrahydrofolate cyclo-ligase [Oligoflexus sp.]|uniref:5-formyltetrahydrofolate cyclo-ligase n=1 Tax=Oligoflexus sp. TaxID=1971216 RepID=UPI002D5780D6|nr:5-formyltetrahydrofolate cyclo-ligase [Oligoflexus sp.]HYX36697.1 5-formyltetrahydrofolate cyclo-ligase [Oligoflexus sp.]
MHKATLRKQLLQKRLAMPESEWCDKSQKLVQQLLTWMKGQTFDHYILYRSFRREPSLEQLAALLPVQATYYPRIQGQSMDFYSSSGAFVTNRFGLEEPEPHPAHQLLTFSPKTLLIIPALAYDHRCFRLGYGGGFFDRFLAHHKVTTLGVCFEAFLVNELPTEPHDHPVQSVSTDSRFLTAPP